jgi:hypothetical protein
MMRRLLPIALLLAHAAPAIAQPDGRHFIDGQAALVVRADADQLERLATLARSLGGDALQAVNLVSIGSAGALGFDLLSRPAWAVVGLDPARPFFVQVSLSRVGTRHLRVVARIQDTLDFTAWSRRVPALNRMWTASDGVGDLGALLGTSGADTAEAARLLKGKRIEVVGWSSLFKVFVLLRRDGNFMLADLFFPRGRGIDWSRDGTGMLARLDPPLAADSLAARRGAARLTGTAGLVAWTRPGGLFDLLAQPSERACGDLAPAARDSGLADLGLRLLLRRDRLHAEAVFGLADAKAPVAAALAIANDGVAGQRRAGAIAAGELRLRGVDRFRDLPRAPAIRAGWVPLWRRVRRCGGAIRIELLAFAWPELAAQWLEEVAALSPDAAALVSSVRNVGFAARKLSLRDRRVAVAFAEVSILDRGKPVADAMLDALFAGGQTVRRPRRHQAWGGSTLRPYAIGARSPSIVGTGFGEASRDWRLRFPRSDRRGASDEVGRLSADGAAVLRQLAPDLGRLAGLGKAAAARLGSVDGAITLTSLLLRADFTIKLR